MRIVFPESNCTGRPWIMSKSGRSLSCRVESLTALPSIAHPYHDTAQSVLDLLRGRSKSEDLMSALEPLGNPLAESMHDTANLGVLWSIIIRPLFHTGSRSFPHFLNAVERYLPPATGPPCGRNLFQLGRAKPRGEDGHPHSVCSLLETKWSNGRHRV